MRLNNKVALITGAASGIGKKIAHTYAKEGATVAIADLNGEKAQEVAAEFRHQGLNAIGLAMDVTQEEQVNQGVDTIVAQFKKIDVLVSNAGLQIISSLTELSLQNWQKMLAVHLDGAFLTTKACLKHMYQQGKGGSIIYMGSIHSKEASVLKAPYVTAKHGLLGLCKVVAKEGISYGVRANVICPGFVRTPLVEKQIPEQAAKLGLSEEEVVKKIMLKETLDGEFTTLEDVAEAAVWFASFASNALTGQSLVVTHGWFMQ